MLFGLCSNCEKHGPTNDHTDYCYSIETQSLAPMSFRLCGTWEASQLARPFAVRGRTVLLSAGWEVAKIIERVEPVYPPLARQTRVQGTVRLHAIIAIGGSIEELEVISGHPLLIQPALDAVRRWRYAPTVLNGQPVEVDTTIDVIFSLEENRSPSVSLRAAAL